MEGKGPIVLLNVGDPCAAGEEFADRLRKRPYIYSMRIFLPLVLASCLIAASTQAQEHSSVSLSMGPALPVGQFANQDGESPSSGLARIGGLLDLSYQYRLGKGPFGLTGELRARLNPMNEDAALTSLKAVDTGYAWTVAKKSWEAGAALAGAYYRSPLTGKFSLELALTVGCAEAVLPPFAASGIRNSPNYPGHQDYIVVSSNKVHALAPTGLFKAGVRYPLTPHFSLVAYMDFCYLKPTFRKVTENITTAEGLVVPNVYSLANGSVVYNDSNTADYTQHMNSVDAGIGLALRL